MIYEQKAPKHRSHSRQFTYTTTTKRTLVSNPINAYTSCRERRNSTLSRKCAPRTRFSAVREQGPEVEEAFLVGAQAPRAPIEFRGCVRGARGGCPQSVRPGGGRLPVWWVSCVRLALGFEQLT